MKKFLKKCFTVFAACICLATCALGTGCQKTHAEYYLNVYCWDAGYGVEWCKEILKSFSEQEWVKEKYPDMEYDFSFNDREGYAGEQIAAGKRINDFNVLFSSNLEQYIGTGDIADLRTSVYEKEVPGETVTYGDKMLDNFYMSNKFIPSGEAADTDNYKMYSTSWAAGMGGFLVNIELLRNAGLEKPVTTNEFFDVCDYFIKNKTFTDKDGDAYVVHNSKQGTAAYLTYMFPALWAQYDGFENFLNFYNGIDEEGYISNGIFEREGRLKALEFYEKLIGDDYCYKYSTSVEFMTAQLDFLRGKGIFMPNGDWFDYEMGDMKKEAAANNVKIYEIEMLQMPVISALIEKTPTIKALPGNTDDEKLAKVIRAIDNGATSYENVSQADFETVAKARSIIFTIGQNQQGVIPSYADNQELAADFLRFMATDIAQDIYAISTNGCSLPFHYDMKTSNPSLYESLTGTQKSRIKAYEGNKVCPATILPAVNNYPLVMYGSLQPLNQTISSLFETFNTTNKTAMDIFNATKAEWTESKFKSACDRAGISVN